MRVVLYARVSKDDGDQDPENQLSQLRQWCASAGHHVVKEYIEQQSGRKGADQRSALAALLSDAHKRKFDLVLFWALDRFSREGMLPTLRYLQQLADSGISFHSYTEPHLSTDNELVRNVLLAIMSSLAKVEAQRISDRTIAGLNRARAKGKVLGRPKIDAAKEEAIRELLRARTGVGKVARLTRSGVGTVARIKAEMAEQSLTS